MIDQIKKTCHAIAAGLRLGNGMARRFYEFLRKIGVFYYYYWQDMVDRRDPTEVQIKFAQTMDSLSDKVAEVEQLLADEMSRKVYRNIIEYRKTKNRKYLKGIVSRHQYFQRDIFTNISDHEAFVDGGSYDGSDIVRFAKFVGSYDSIHAFEPLEDIIKEIEKKVKKNKLENVHIYPVGLWKENTVLRFCTTGNGSKICTDENEAYDTVHVNSLDQLFPNEKITWIKMDIEGSEVDAILGAENLIKRERPKLAICIYHKPEDLVDIPLLIKRMVPQYKLYIRHHTRRALETVLYAVAE